MNKRRSHSLPGTGARSPRFCSMSSCATRQIKPFRPALLVTILATLLAGCGPTPTPEPTSTPRPTLPATETPAPTPAPALGDRQTRPTDGMIMVYVPAGEFVMGSTAEEVDYALQLCLEHDTNCSRSYFSIEQPTHTVVLDSFWLDQTEVTNSQYAQCVEAGACEEPECEADQSAQGDHPVVCVTWNQAAAYCDWAGGRLPTEAEWEYAARGTAVTRYPWGDELEGTWLNYCDVNCTLSKSDETFDDGYATTAPVGSYPQGVSWVGALDMAGNVWELVADWYGTYSPELQVNPTGPSTGGRKVVRGGSWHTSPDHARSTLRTHTTPDTSIDHAGFRCVRSIPTSGPTATPTQTPMPTVTPTPEPIVLQVPTGEPPILDGTLSPDEWSGAVEEELAGGGKLLLLHSEGYLYLGIQGEFNGLGSVCVDQGDQVAILHSSAALGTAVYEPRDEGWFPTVKFDYCCRSTGNSASAQREREQHLQQEGWLANIAYMGETNEMEYQIAMPTGSLRLAVTYLGTLDGFNYDAIVWWPERLADDCRRLDLVQGYTPGGLQFFRENWVTVTKPDTE